MLQSEFQSRYSDSRVSSVPWTLSINSYVTGVLKLIMPTNPTALAKNSGVGHGSLSWARDDTYSFADTFTNSSDKGKKDAAPVEAIGLSKGN